MCPPGYLDSHAKGNTGTYDSIVVEAGDGLEGAVLGQVTRQRWQRGEGAGWGDILL